MMPVIMTLCGVSGWVKEEPEGVRTYKLPRRKIRTIEAFCLFETLSPSTIRTGSVSMAVSMATSTAPVTIQKMLKLKQCSTKTRPTQFCSIGWQLKMVAMVVAIQKARTTMPTTRDCSRKEASIEKMRRYMRRMDIFTAVTQL